MSSFWNFLFGAVLVVIWIIAGGYVTQASVYLTSYRNLDLQMHSAYWFTFWAAFVTWFLIAIFIILIILSIIGVVALFGTGVGEAGVAAEGVETGVVATEGVEAAEVSRYSQAREYAKSPQGQNAINQGISWFTIAFLIFALILVSITGILSAVAAATMVKSSNFKNDDPKLSGAYTDCIIAASMCLGAAGILIIGMITYFIIGYQREKKIEAQKELAEKEKRVEVAELRQLQQRSALQKAQEQGVFREELQRATQQAAIQRISQQIAGPPLPPRPTYQQPVVQQAPRPTYQQPAVQQAPRQIYQPTVTQPSISQQYTQPTTSEAIKQLALQQLGIQQQTGVSTSQSLNRAAAIKIAQQLGIQVDSGTSTSEIWKRIAILEASQQLK